MAKSTPNPGIPLSGFATVIKDAVPEIAEINELYWRICFIYVSYPCNLGEFWVILGTWGNSGDTILNYHPFSSLDQVSFYAKHGQVVSPIFLQNL